MFFMQASDFVINYLNKNKFFCCPIYIVWYCFAHYKEKMLFSFVLAKKKITL